MKKSENRVGTTRVTSPYSTKMELGLPYVTLTKSNENIHKCNITNFVRQDGKYAMYRSRIVPLFPLR